MIARRHAPAALTAAAVVALALLALALQGRGYVSASNLDLWGRALLANAGLSPFGDMVGTFPPLPYLATVIVDGLFPQLGVRTPALLSAVLGALLAGAWFASFLRNAIAPSSALICTLALAVNPLFLRAVAEGPGFVLLHWGFWLTAMGVFGIRRSHRVNDIILVSMGLALIGFSHPFGIVLAAASLPFLALVVPPDRLRDSPFSIFLVMLFPLLFAGLSVCYVSWVFQGEPLAFLGTISRESAGLGSLVAAMASRDETSAWGVALLGMFAACPVAIAMFARSRGMAPLRFAVAALFASLLAAAVLAGLVGLVPSSALVASLSISMAAACAGKWPAEHARRSELALLLVAGVAGGGVVALADPAPETARWRTAIAGAPVAPPDPQLAELGQVLARRDAVLFDADAAPVAIAERGTARGIWSAGSDPFRMAVLRGPEEARTIVVRSPDAVTGSDRVGQLFPDLQDGELPGYRRIYDNARWHVFARQGDAP